MLEIGIMWLGAGIFALEIAGRVAFAADGAKACPPSTTKMAVETFDDRLAMCSIYGNFADGTRSAKIGADSAQIVLSEDYTEEGTRKHALVIGVRLADPCATCTGTAHVYVYRYEGGAWVHEKHRTAAASGGLLGAPPQASLVRMGPERLGVRIHAHSTPSGGYTVDSDVFLGLYGEGLHAITPIFGGGKSRPCQDNSTLACDERTYTFAFQPGGDPVWHDLVVTEVWKRRELGRKDAVPLTHESRYVYRGAAYAQVSPPPELGALTRFTGRVGDAPIDLALIQSPTRIVGTFHHAKVSGFLRGDAAGHLVDEMRAGAWTGSFSGKIVADTFSGSWRGPNSKTEVPFAFTRITPASGPITGSYASTDASLVISEPTAGPGGDLVEVTGTSLWGGATLSGKHPYDGEIVSYDDGKCKLLLHRSYDVLVVQQLTERCGPAGTFDSLDVGPYFLK